MKNQATRAVLSAIVALCLTGGLVATFGKRPARAIVRQPKDYLSAIASELQLGNSFRDKVRMVNQVTSMFWGCYEVRMLDGRAWSGLPYYQEPKMENTGTNTPYDGVEIDII